MRAHKFDYPQRLRTPKTEKAAGLRDDEKRGSQFQNLRGIHPAETAGWGGGPHFANPSCVGQAGARPRKYFGCGEQKGVRRKRPGRPAVPSGTQKARPPLAGRLRSE